MLRLKILIIDNEPRWIEFTKENLVNFEISVVSSAEEALHAFASNHFDLVIASSLQLQALETIKQQYGGQTVFVATTNPNRKEERQAYLLGAKRYISKKFDPDSLKHEIAAVVPIVN